MRSEGGDLDDGCGVQEVSPGGSILSREASDSLPIIIMKDPTEGRRVRVRNTFEANRKRVG